VSAFGRSANLSGSTWKVSYDYDKGSNFRFKHTIEVRTGRLTLNSDGNYEFQLDGQECCQVGTWVASEHNLVLDLPQTKKACGWHMDGQVDGGHLEGTHSFFGGGCDTLRKKLRFTAIRTN
jgi:hypothetical protein